MQADRWRALVVEDERLARTELVDLLRHHPDIEVIGDAESVETAREQAQRLHPDVIFLDIQLGDATGFDVLNAVQSDCQVIFVTAHDEHAIRAFEINALDYLLKPVHPQRLASAIARLGQPQPGHKSNNALPYDGHLFIDEGALRGFVAVREIRCVLAAGDYTRVVLAGDKQVLLRRTMSEWESRLPGTHFVRIQRSAIVNREHVQNMERLGNGTFEVELDRVRERLNVSRRYAARLKASVRSNS